MADEEIHLVCEDTEQLEIVREGPPGRKGDPGSAETLLATSATTIYSTDFGPIVVDINELDRAWVDYQRLRFTGPNGEIVEGVLQPYNSESTVIDVIIDFVDRNWVGDNNVWDIGLAGELGEVGPPSNHITISSAAPTGGIDGDIWYQIPP